MSPRIRPAAPRLAAPSRPSPRPAAQSAPAVTPGRSGESSFVSAGRQALIQQMMPPGMPDGPARRAIEQAASSFSEPQLRRMQQRGIHFTVAARDDMHGARARYLPQSHEIQVPPNARVHDVRHELAHAWDDVRNDAAGRGQSPTDRFHSQVNPELADAFEQYRRTHGGDSGTMYTPGQHPRQAASNPWECYATGFALYHSGNPEDREVVRRAAPALFRVLQREAPRE